MPCMKLIHLEKDKTKKAALRGAVISFCAATGRAAAGAPALHGNNAAGTGNFVKYSFN
jgi:hypothetical protein